MIAPDPREVFPAWGPCWPFAIPDVVVAEPVCLPASLAHEIGREASETAKPLVEGLAFWAAKYGRAWADLWLSRARVENPAAMIAPPGEPLTHRARRKSIRRST